MTGGELFDAHIPFVPDNVLMAGPRADRDEASRGTAVPDGVDHLVYAVADLERGMDEIDKLLGVRPVRGGRHPAFGTHNALVSLAPSTYLEIIAPDPGLARPAQGVLFESVGAGGPRLATWVLNTHDIEGVAALANSAGLGLGAVQSGSREQPDGTLLSWRLTDPYAMPLDGAVPFLISWGETPHPAGVVPRAGELTSLIVEHPEPARVRRAFEVLGANLVVHRGESFRLVARIASAAGEVELY